MTIGHSDQCDCYYCELGRSIAIRQAWDILERDGQRKGSYPRTWQDYCYYEIGIMKPLKETK
jgi:hypothetical protein